jgi:hypothetical protein
VARVSADLAVQRKTQFPRAKSLLGCCIVVAGLTVFPFAPALAWGDLGHQAIGEAAVTSPRLKHEAREAIRKILGNTDLAAIATWPDRVRDAQRRHAGPLAKDPEALALIKAFPANPSWHFVNLPLGTPNYSDSGKFSAPNNIVIQIKYCIEVLEGKKSDMTKRQALSWLVHLVGDVHQPLHVGIGFFKINPATNAVELVRDPNKVTPDLFNDRGGNQLFYSASKNLHAYWDGDLVKKIIPGKKTYESLARVLLTKMAKEEAGWNQSGITRPGLISGLRTRCTRRIRLTTPKSCTGSFIHPSL